MPTSPTETSRNLEMQEIVDQPSESTDIDQNNNLEEVLEITTDSCIYRIPKYLRDINKEAYTPHLISIGPLHYGRTELNEMEKHKRRYQSNFCGREQVNEQKWKELVAYVKENEQRIRNHYLATSDLSSSEYVDMILYDAVFIIEIFTRCYYNAQDFFLSNTQLKSDLIRDFLLLENQLPYFVLNDLYMKVFGGGETNPSFCDLSVKFFRKIGDFEGAFPKQPEVKHFVDLIRQGIVMGVYFRLDKETNFGVIKDLPNATKLKESGLTFKGINDRWMLDMNMQKRKSWKWLPRFEVNEVQIPRIEVYEDIECQLRNMMVFEVFHYPTETYLCHYADLMDHLIDTAKDVDLLFEKGVIAYSVGNTEAIAKMFNSLCPHIKMSPSYYYEIAEKMKAHYKYPLNHVKATLKSVYFSNIWTGTATVAAIFLLIFTFIQAICSIIQVIQG